MQMAGCGRYLHVGGYSAKRMQKELNSLNEYRSHLAWVAAVFFMEYRWLGGYEKGAITCMKALNRAIRCGDDTCERIYDRRGLLVF